MNTTTHSVNFTRPFITGFKLYFTSRRIGIAFVQLELHFPYVHRQILRGRGGMTFDRYLLYVCDYELTSFLKGLR